MSAQGGQAVVLAPPEILAAVADRRINALIYDLEPGADSAAEIVRQARAIRRDLPIWLYHPLRSGMAELAAEAGSLAGVWTTQQMRGGADESEVTSHVKKLISFVPYVRLERLLHNLMGWLPPIVERFVGHTLRYLQQGASQPPKVHELAAAAHVSPHWLEATCASAGLAPPKRMLDSLSLVFVAFMSWSSGTPIAAAGKRAGLATDDLNRLRTRVIGPRGVWHQLPAVDQFALAAIAVSKLCNTSSEQARDKIDSFVRESTA